MAKVLKQQFSEFVLPSPHLALNSSDLTLLKVLALTYHHSHFLATNLGFHILFFLGLCTFYGWADLYLF